MKVITTAWQTIPHRAKQISLAIIVLFLSYSAIGFWGIPALITAYLPGKLGPALHRTITIKTAAFNPYTLDMKIENIKIADPDGTPFVAVDVLFCDMCWVSLIKFMPVTKELQIIHPQLFASRSGGGVFNFSDLAGTKTSGEKTGPEQEQSLPRFLIEQFHLSNGQVTFTDAFVPSGFKTTIAPVDINVTNLTSLPERATTYQLSLATESGETLACEGKTGLASRKADGRLTLARVLLKKYLPYYGDLAKIDVSSGTLAVQSAFQIDASGTDVAGGVSGIQVSVNDLRLTDAANKLREVLVSGINLSGGSFSLASRTACVEKLGVESLKLSDRTQNEIKASLSTLTMNKAAVELSSLKTTVDSLDLGGLTVAMEKNQAALSHLTVKEITTDIKAQAAGIEGIVLEGLAMTMENQQEKLLVDLAQLDVTKATADASTQVAGIGNIDVRTLTLKRGNPEEPLVDIQMLGITDISVNVKDRTVMTNELKAEKGEIYCSRSRNGDINLIQPMALFPAPDKKEPKKVQPSQSEGGPSPWTIGLNILDLKDYTVDIKDLFPQDAVTARLHGITATIKDFSTAPGHQFDLSLAMTVAEQGHFETSGKIMIAPVTADLDVKMSDIAIKTFHPYWDQKIGILLTDGRLNSQGHVTAAINPQTDPDINFKGVVSIVNMDTIDIFTGGDLVKWNNLSLEGMDAGLSPTHLTIGEVALTDYFARLAIGEDGRLSVMNVLRQEAANAGTTIDVTPPQAEEETRAPMPRVRIDHITLQGGQINFADSHVKPNYKADFYNLGGRISGLDSAEETRADVLLQGNLENHSPMEIKGRVNPLAPKSFVDIVLSFKDITLGPFTPYSGKYIGRKIKKGKLQIDLAYSLENRKLKAENRFLINDLVLGDTVVSPDAINLPVDLAISLLKDRSGNIDLNIPIQGDLDNPEFSLGSTILAVIRNLITKIITAPFSLLGALVGGGTELSSVDFDAGRSDLNSQSTEILDKLATALIDRPGLRLEAEGLVDPESDSRELRNLRLDELLAARKQLMAARNPSSPAATTLSPAAPKPEAATSTAPASQPEAAGQEETPAVDPALTAVYLAADFPKPKDETGKIKTLPAEEMKKLLLASMEVTESDLRQLALKRAETVWNYLVNTQKVDRDRVFVLDSEGSQGKSAAPAPSGEKQPGKGRVQFKLK
ncbi:MAG: DUF748 domain-containing protein [Pseudomonadota bacterium]